MKTIHIQEEVSEEASIFEELINERYEEYRYDQKRPLLSPDDLFIKYKDFLDHVKDRKIIHNEIFRLYNKGLGYRRIHRNMVENGFDVAKSSTAIDSIIKKRLKREAFLNQPITNEYSNYDIEFLRVSD